MLQTRTALRIAEEGNLTQLEFLALNSELNVADGHARQTLTAGQSEVIDRLPNLFAEAEKRPVDDIEREAHSAYFHLLGQHEYLTSGAKVLSCYSSSVAMEILSRSLLAGTDTVALLHPTFDNIADILRGVGLRLMPLSEDMVHGDDDRERGIDENVLRSVGCVFITTPNNPTGRVLSQHRLRLIAEQCAAHDVVLALDTSFRGFDSRAHYDHYAVLAASGCRWMVIEDTGKLWPTLDLKVGLLVAPEHIALPVEKIYSDILLGVSPLILALVREFAQDAADGGLDDLHRFIAANRALVRAELADVPGVSFRDTDSRVSVERVHLGDRSAHDVWEALSSKNVYALPCGQFHWANPVEGEHLLRIALARSAPPLLQSVRALRSVLVAG